MSIHKKLLEFQKQNITITKDATNPHFRSSYSSLNEVLAKVKRPLNLLGVVIVQRVEQGIMPENDRPHLVTELIDVEDATKVGSSVPFVGATDMQKLGGAITYARRYSLVTLLGLEDEDDDGNTASGPKPAARAPQKPAQRPTGPVDMDDVPFGESDLPDFSID